MARPLRIGYPGAFYHIYVRGLERRKIRCCHFEKVRSPGPGTAQAAASGIQSLCPQNWVQTIGCLQSN